MSDEFGDPRSMLADLADTRRLLDAALSEGADARRAVQKSCKDLEGTFRRIRGENGKDGAFSVHTPRIQPASELDDLTNREMSVLRLIAEGHSTKQLAAKLNITFKTAVSHRTHLLQKLGVHESASLVRIAIRAGLIRA